MVWSEQVDKAPNHKQGGCVNGANTLHRLLVSEIQLLTGEDKCCSVIAPATINFASFFGSGRDKYRQQKDT